MSTPCLDENGIAELLEGHVTEEERAEIETHVDECERCYRAVAGAATLLPGHDESTAADSGEDTEHEPLPKGASVHRFVVLGLLGRGGMGVVYAAYDPELDRKVAIKVLRPARLAADRSLQGRVLREAQAMAKLSHPNVVTVYDVGTVEDRVFVAMELVEGETLSRWLARVRRSRREILTAFRDAGRGLAAAHAAGLVHRDFKPDNVLVGADGRVRVTDFGLARTLEPETAPAGRVVGTPAYMSPEQGGGRPVDARGDIFSYCISLYEALYGEHPFAGSSPAELQKTIARGEVRDPPRGAHVPSWLRRILLRGLSVDPARRFGTIEELLHALGRDPAVRNRRWALALFGALAVAGAAVGISRAVTERSRTCSGAAAHLDAVWGAAEKDRARAAFVATGRPRAEETFARVEKVLGTFAAEWTAMHTRACEATRVTGEQPEAVLALRMACLWRRREELATLAYLYTTADGAVVDEALKAAYGLGGLRACADVGALTTPTPLPADAATRARVEELRLRLARFRALALAGKLREAEPAVAALLPAVEALAYKPLQAEALLLIGHLRELRADYARAAEATRDAVVAAAEGRAQKLVAAAWTQLVWIVGHQQGKADPALEYARNARALLAGLGGDPEAEAQLASNLGAVLLDRGKYEEAEARFREALAKREPIVGPEHPQLARLYVNIAVALAWREKFAEAIPLEERALEIYRRSFGERHPLYGHTLGNLADALLNAGRLDEARTAAERAIRVLEEALGPEHAHVATAVNMLGLVALRQRRYRDAQALLGRAALLAEKARGAEHVFVAHARSMLGVSLAQGGEHVAALLELRRALRIYEKAKNEVLVAQVLGSIGTSLLETGPLGEARATLERALAQMGRRRDVDHESRARTRFALARAILRTGGDAEQARSLAGGARADFVKAGPGLEPEIRAVEEWLRGRR